MSEIDWIEIDRVLNMAITRVADRLPAGDVKDMQQSVYSGEPGLAFETLCTQLYEYDVRLEPHLVKELAKIGVAMGLDPNLWRDLRT